LSRTLNEESMTAMRVPARAAAVMSSFSIEPTAVALTNTAVVPATAAAIVSGRAGSMLTTSAVAGRPAVSGWRVSARTGAPSASRPATR
jgi:hypothetical protein